MGQHTRKLTANYKKKKKKKACHGSTTVPRMREGPEDGIVLLSFINLSHFLIQTEASTVAIAFYSLG